MRWKRIGNRPVQMGIVFLLTVVIGCSVLAVTSVGCFRASNLQGCVSMQYKYAVKWHLGVKEAALGQFEEVMC